MIHYTLRINPKIEFHPLLLLKNLSFDTLEWITSYSKMVFCKTQFPIQLFARHLFFKEVQLQYYVLTKTTISNMDFFQEKLLQEYKIQDRKIPKQVETKTFCSQDKTFPWQSNFKSIFAKTCLGKKLSCKFISCKIETCFGIFILEFKFLE